MDKEGETAFTGKSPNHPSPITQLLLLSSHCPSSPSASLKPIPPHHPFHSHPSSFLPLLLTHSLTHSPSPITPTNTRHHHAHTPVPSSHTLLTHPSSLLHPFTQSPKRRQAKLTTTLTILQCLLQHNRHTQQALPDRKQAAG